MLHRKGRDWPVVVVAISTIATLWVASCSHSEGTRREAFAAETSGSESAVNRQDQSGEASLASRRLEYASYFNSLKDLVRRQWSPAELYRQHDPDRTAYGQQDRYTLLQVRISEEGSLADVRVVHACGLDWFDETALEAFRKAQPFAPPPRTLLRPGGFVEFGFGFFFDTKQKEPASSPRLKLFRYRDTSQIPDQR